MIYLQLFLSFLQIGALSFGGGYAAIPLIQAQAIERYGWLTQEAFTELVTIAEMTPGPIAVNAATFVGNTAAGIPGAAAATVGVILPSCVFVTILAFIYQKYRKLTMMQGILKFLRPAVIALIFTAGLKILIPLILPDGLGPFSEINIGWSKAVWFIAAFIVLRKTKLNPILVILCCGAAELLFQSLLRLLGLG